MCRRITPWLLVFFTLAAAQFWKATGQTAATETGWLTNVWNREVAEKASLVFRQLAAPARHYAGLSEADATRLLQSDVNYQGFLREKLQNRWFAALVDKDEPAPYRVEARFTTWRELVEFLAEKRALVDVWAYGEAGERGARRIPAPELAALKQQAHEQPTFITVTYVDGPSGKALTFKLEFAFEAAEAVWAAEQAYQRHRRFQLEAHEILGARNPKGSIDAVTQWTALQNQVRKQDLVVSEMPALPTDPKDIFVAFEFEVDEQNNFSKVARVYRDSEVQKRVVGDVQILVVRKAGEKSSREVLGFSRLGLGGELRPVTNAILGQDVVELRVKDPTQPDTDKWHVLEFGEPEVLKQSALAHFAQLNAYLERKRKARAMTQANVALVAEPIIAGLNIGGGIAGLGFPAGEAGRLLYNLITWELISQVPTTKEMRELFALMAARDHNLEIKLKPERFLTKEDMKTLKEAGSKLTDQEIQTYLEQMSDEDVRAMLRLARQGMFDARITTFLNILASTFKVSGLSDQAGWIRDVFNNVRFSVNGDINISTLLLIALGKENLTALSGVSLHDLAYGRGPTEAWLQYLVVSVDVRAVLNTIVRLMKSTLAKKELEKPFPYSPRMSELAAYEIRIFGFPLLMFYKRALIKADREAYEHDYAYGLYGVRLAEHFPTREEMEAEIRAGRMFPLGLVKVPSATGWKETDLVVYGHRVSSGKFRGKTTLVIYGLKAYAEYSELIGRELFRFKEFEKGLRAGAVIEQRMWEEAGSASPSISYEPQIHAGSNSVQTIFSPLLGNLLEYRRHSLRQSWGLPVDEAEFIQAREHLAELDVQPVEPDPLVRIDPYYSSFIYRRQVGGHPQTIKVTSIPSLTDLDRELRKAEEAKLIEEIRRDAAANKGAGVVLLNEVVPVHGHLEMGPLLRDQDGQVFGVGVASGVKAMEDIFQFINRLPVTDRARLRFNHFAGTVVELEGEGRGKAFLTIEFPLGPVTNEWTNPLTGERETVLYEGGLWRQTITGRRIVDVEYDANQLETSSRIYLNRGTREEPIRGPLLEETRTLDYWHRDLSQPDLNPYQPTIAKLRVNYVTGQSTRETYGLFTLPVEVADDQYVTQNRYTPYGIFDSAEVFDTCRDEGDFLRPAETKVLAPITGGPRFHLASQLANHAVLRDLSTAEYRTVVERRDLVKALTRTETFDNARFGRKVAERYVDPFDGQGSFSTTVTWDYQDDFQAGLIPVRALTLGLPAGARLSEVTTTSYDPLSRRLSGFEVTYTGKTQTNTWDYRWNSPIEIETAQRRVNQEFDREETASRSSTSLKSTGEVLSQTSAQFEILTKTWHVTRQVWYRPLVPERIETNIYSAFGKLIRTRLGNSLEVRPSFTPDGMEQSSSTFQTNAASGRFDILCRREDDYHWQKGERDSRVQVYAGDSACDEFREHTDAEGRTVEDGIRNWPQLELRTVRTYDGGSERVFRAEVFQNGELRATYETLGVVSQPGGGWLLKVKASPFWGLVSTNTYLLGEPFGRLVESEIENGERTRVTAWLGGTGIAQSSELVDRHGRIRERFLKRVNEGSENGIPYDLIARSKVSPWGETAPVEELALVRGTDVSLFCDRLGERLHFDLSKRYQSPEYATDPHQHFGLRVDFQGTLRSNVTAVFTSQIRLSAQGANTNEAPERVMELAKVDLQGFFSYPISRRTFDRAGNLLEESRGKIKSLGARAPSAQTLLAELGQAAYPGKTSYGYQPGWMRRQLDKTGRAAIVFTPESRTNAAARSVNDAGWREWPTVVSNFYTLPENTPGIMPGFFLSRRFDSPRLLSANRYLPGVTNVWEAWSGTELSPTGDKLFESDNIFDSRGELSTVVVHKQDSRGRPATKIVYQLPDPSAQAWRTISPRVTPNDSRFDLSGSGDFSSCDFVAFFMEPPAPAVSVQFRDAFNRTLLVASRGWPSNTYALSFWPLSHAQVLWLPNDSLPRRGATVAASRTVLEEGKLFVVSVAELAKTGLSVDRLASAELILPKPATGSIRATPLYRLEPGEPVLAPEAELNYTYDSQTHSANLELFQRRKAHLSSREKRTGQGWNSIVAYEGLAVGSLAPLAQGPYYPVLSLTDNSDPDSLQPLYALAAEDGRFLEYYRTVRAGNSRVYTIVHGFDTPKMEVFRAGVLDDEISAGILAFGHGYYVTLPMAKASGVLPNAVARLHNRCVGSAFALGAESLLGSFSDVGRRPAGEWQPVWLQASAQGQARDIEKMPTLAEAILPTRPLPWSQTEATTPVAFPPFNARNAKRALLRLQHPFITSTNGLIPTSPASAAERYVDTVQEAAIIDLAVNLRELATAKQLLSFYWDKSQGGAKKLHMSYDAWTGASLGKQPRYARPYEAPETVRAQLAMAQAAFCFGTAARDTNALKFGTNLIYSVLNGFQPSTNDTSWPRGIAERPIPRPTRRRGPKLWPKENAFSVGSNARAFLLFKRLREEADNHPFPPEWKQTVVAAEQEEAAWLTNQVVRYARSAGVVPEGLFEIQDVQNETTALAIDRWTTTDDWLSFLEAADGIGISRDTLRGWLRNLARAHGVVVKGIWGLDWAIPLQRPDAISTELTVKFRRLAELLGDREAAAFAQRNLDQLHLLSQGEPWPVLITSATTNAPLQTGEGSVIYPLIPKDQSRKAEGVALPWPETLGVYAEEQANARWSSNARPGTRMEATPRSASDITQFFWTAAGFYLAIVAVALFWWVLSYARRRRGANAATPSQSGRLLPEPVMQEAEERWAKRVLGMRAAPAAERSRYSNAAIEQNFHMHLRAIYKLALEWRRVVNGWMEDDRRLVEDASDEWLNGLDEFAAMIGIYTRWVIKAGRKDGLRKRDVLQENEDSNHIWSRLVMYFSESHLRLLRLMKDFKANPAAAGIFGVNDQIELVLRTMGARARQTPFDARVAFEAPTGAATLDLLLLQLPGTNLTRVVEEMERKLDIPREHIVGFIKGFRSFKEREQLFPIAPYVLEAAKVLPHFLLMGLVGLIWYNAGDLKIFLYLGDSLTEMALNWQHSLIWALPLFIGAGFSTGAHYLRVYRFRWGVGGPSGRGMALDAEVSNLFGRATQVATPALRTSRWWNPLIYQRAGWVLRAVGLGLLAVELLRLDPPTFATFMFVKVLLGMLLLMESASLLGPIIISPLSRWLEDHVSGSPHTWRVMRFINLLNILPTRPASLVWLSIKYHFQPSVPTGSVASTLKTIGSYLAFGAVFLFVGSYMFEQALEVWFREAYQGGWDLELVLGMLLFWNTMYLLRFGLFVLLATLASAVAIYPVIAFWAVVALGCLGLQLVHESLAIYINQHLMAATAVALAGLLSMAFEPWLLAWLGNRRRRGGMRQTEAKQTAPEQFRLEPSRALGVVYMSGDDLSFHKLTSDLLMTRLKALRDQLGSGGMQLLFRMQLLPDDSVLSQRFKGLYDLEAKHDITLWHPAQLVVAGHQPGLRPELGLNIVVDDLSQRHQLLATWHLRRWLVTMMSTAGHSQDTAINLVDIALALARDKLGPNTIFYLIQNKYDNNDNNRPSQLSYDKGELGQRNKLARLLMELAPGSRAYSVNDWTPFGFKAGGLVGMDLVYEESLKLTNMLILDRNANAHDLQAVVSDLKLALSDPGVVIVIPGRGTTNTLTPIGQGSQLIEEGHRALTRGVMLLGGNGAETLGTGWGNIQAIFYGQVQRALCDTNTSKMPLTTPSQRGATFGDRCEGLIGFGPHAIGISEDIWGVTQAAHNAMALGYQVTFQRSRALWHKTRESWSHAEWFSAFPRWSGGYVQMMLDPLMQQINDGGPWAVFAKEIRANGGRFFLSAPFALLNILSMPLAIIWDVSPFVQILILLWNLGLVMNQVLTALGLVACLESTGFNRATAVTGTLGAALLAAWVPAWSRFGLPLAVLGFVAGGFAMGFGRWLYYRARDVMLFGPQLVIHALGQVVRQSLEFVLSGASANDARAVNIAFRAWVGPREDRPFEGYQNFVNLRTVVWGVGLVALLLNLFALSHLDFLNVLLLLPSLMFSVSTLLGPFLAQPKPGNHLGFAVCAPRLMGWIASCGFYMLVARLIALGQWYQRLGMGLCLLCFGWILAKGMKYVGYSTRLRTLTSRLAHQMTGGGLAAGEAQKLVQFIVRNLGGDVEKTSAALQKTSLAEEVQTAVVRTVQEKLGPLLKRPVADTQRHGPLNHRFISELSRSFVQGLFTFIWFFVVPMPGLLVFTAPGGYRISISLAGVLAFAAGTIAAVLAAGSLSLLLERWEKYRLQDKGLVAAIDAQYRAFQSSAAAGSLSPWQTSLIHALFTDVQTYFDQRSYAYAKRSLDLIARTLERA